MIGGVSHRVAREVVLTHVFWYGDRGNRVRMEDGMGRVDYEYDVLGRLVAETRYFNELGQSYRLTYQYDLAGELTQVTNPWGVVVGYTRDQTGQVTAITGAGYAGVSVYAQGIRYRAFGAVRQVTYGNGRQLSVAYDNRLRVSRWEVSGVLGWEYEYDNFGERSGRATACAEPVRRDIGSELGVRSGGAVDARLQW